MVSPAAALPPLGAAVPREIVRISLFTRHAAALDFVTHPPGELSEAFQEDAETIYRMLLDQLPSVTVALLNRRFRDG